jgi:hypothetical protein
MELVRRIQCINHYSTSIGTTIILFFIDTTLACKVMFLDHSMQVGNYIHILYPSWYCKKAIFLSLAVIRIFCNIILLITQSNKYSKRQKLWICLTCLDILPWSAFTQHILHKLFQRTDFYHRSVYIRRLFVPLMPYSILNETDVFDAINTLKP